jgi:predicted aldo/keto reductase-like oxidoreductase
MAKKLGFGLMRLPLTDPEKADSIDIEHMKKMVDMFLERGFTYFDTAWMYCAFKSENAVKEALVERHPRDSYTLASKLHISFVDSMEDRDRIFEEQKKKTGVDYFDYYLLHDIESGNLAKYEQFDCFNWIKEKKASGQIRHMGFSFHSTADVLDKVLTEHPEMEFVQLQINYLDWESEKVQSRKNYEVAVKHGKKVVVMEPVKGGTLANVPEQVEGMLKAMDPNMSVPSWAIRFVATLPEVMMVLSGMSNLEQMDNNTSYMQDFRPLTEEEIETLHRAADVINGGITIPCTGCSYCTEGCPMHIAIPKYFALYNADLRETKGEGPAVKKGEYEVLTAEFGAASTCVQCGQCEGICPQRLPIIKNLQDVAARFE